MPNASVFYPPIDIEKELGGVTWRVGIGIHNSPFRHEATGLTEKQAEALGMVLRQAMDLAVQNAQATARRALGLSEYN